MTSVTTEPTNWRTFLGELGGTAMLKPDLALVTASGDFEDDWFLEIDLGTESGGALLRKCRTYQQYRRSGREEATSGVFPRVLWIVLDPARAALLRGIIAADRALAQDLFTVATADEFIKTINQTTIAESGAHDSGLASPADQPDPAGVPERDIPDNQLIPEGGKLCLARSQWSG